MTKSRAAPTGPRGERMKRQLSTGSARRRAAGPWRDEAGAAAGTAAALARIVLFSTFLPLGLRTISWLQTGAWPALTLEILGLPAPHLPWAGARQALNALYALPVEFVAIAFCGIVYAVATAVLDRRRIAKQRRPRTI